jgi:metal-responsive CopG/Arc/MetJ family transcriptional regulator
MARSKTESAVLTIRVPVKLSQRLSREARRRRQSRSEVARTILQESFGEMDGPDTAAEARRQSLLVSGRRSEREALKFIEHVADLRGWK